MKTSAELVNLVRIGQLREERPTPGEVESLVSSGEARLSDSANTDLSLDSRFDLAYNAGHSLALAALRRLGYRSQNRYLVFQVLPHTLGIAPEIWRVVAKAHESRNVAEYEGVLSVDERLVEDLINAGEKVLSALRAVGVRARDDKRLMQPFA